MKTNNKYIKKKFFFNIVSYKSIFIYILLDDKKQIRLKNSLDAVLQSKYMIVTYDVNMSI